MMTHYILREKIPVLVPDILEWAELFGISDNRIARTFLDGDIEISTVFLGMDHQWIPKGPPLVFETMIFNGVHDGEQWRYSTWDEAEAGHAAAVAHAALPTCEET